MEKIIGYKGFNSLLQCKPNEKCFQYQVGKTYTEDSMCMCKYGFHFCENPFNVWNFYDVTSSRFCIVSSNPANTEKDSEGTKSVTTSITIEKEVSLKEFIEECVRYLQKNNICNDKVQSSSGYNSQLASSGENSKLASSEDYSQLASSGYNSQLASSGDDSKLASSGYNSKLASSGNYSSISSTGKNNVLAAIGPNSKAKGIKGNLLILVEYTENNIPINFVGVFVDGNSIKENTWYSLKNNKLIEVN